MFLAGSEPHHILSHHVYMGRSPFQQIHLHMLSSFEGKCLLVQASSPLKTQQAAEQSIRIKSLSQLHFEELEHEHGTQGQSHWTSSMLHNASMKVLLHEST